jgi:hypothetical protein
MYPVPVGEKTQMTDRSNAPSRSISSITAVTRPWTVSAVSSPE